MNTNINWVEVGSGGIIHDFKVNPELIGKYTKFEENQGPKKNSKLYTLENEAGEDVKFWGGAVIDGRFEYIAIGEMVKIVYEGKQKSKTGTEYNSYRVYHDGAKNKENVMPVVDVDDDEIPTVESDDINSIDVKDIPF